MKLNDCLAQPSMITLHKKGTHFEKSIVEYLSKISAQASIRDEIGSKDQIMLMQARNRRKLIKRPSKIHYFQTLKSSLAFDISNKYFKIN